MAHRMQDKIVIITGASSGLGRATAELMTAEGARVVMADISQEAGEAAAQEIGADFVRTDVGNPVEVDALVSGTVARYGRLDVMCNNAGVHAAGPLLDTTNDDFERVVAVNFAGIFYGTRAAGRVMAEQGSGVIVNTASNGGYLPTEGMAVYCGTKAAVVAMSKACALELAPKGVRVTTISPKMSSFTVATSLFPENWRSGFTSCDWPKLFVPESSVEPIPKPSSFPRDVASARRSSSRLWPISSSATSSMRA